ncbi:AEC family transporter [Bradyrhizobium liaoningense]|uniref:AEC family transporter n=1 Tax=Bradyrhizobium liaoningense TaxID=43992 RepID=UPI0028A22D4F|nr:AEC family transporter [Bradyrhizobium liaoningense]
MRPNDRFGSNSEVRAHNLEVRFPFKNRYQAGLQGPKGANFGLHPVVDKTIELLAQAGSPAALIALGINLFRFEVKAEKLTVVSMCALKLAAMPAIAFVLAKLLNLPPLAAGVVVLLAAMPTGANAYIFAVQYQRLVNPVSGAVALGTLLAAATLPVVVVIVAGS